jgi:hypothetical protein
MRSQEAKKRISGYGTLVRMLLPLFVSVIANPPHKLATPALVHIGTQTLATPCMYRSHTIFTLIYVHVPYLSEFRTWPEFRPVLGCFTFCGVTSRCVTILMMLKCLKMLKINVNSNIYSYFNILRFLHF